MSTVFDACALIAFLRDEPGADTVRRLLDIPQSCFMHAFNHCEVYYDFWRASSQEAAESAMADLLVLGISLSAMIWTRSFGVKWED